MYEINGSLNKKKINIFLAKPNKQIVAKLSEAYEIKRIKRLDGFNELNFTIPTYATFNHMKKENKHIKMIKERYLIKVTYDEDVEWFVVIKLNRSSDDNSEGLSVQCYSLPYELSFKYIKGFKQESINCKQALDICLQGTGWKTGYISSDLLLKFRKFEITSNRWEFLNEIYKTFGEVIPVYDTVGQIVNVYTQEEIGQYKGHKVKFGHLMQSVEVDTDLDKLCTVLHCYGANEISIQRVNLTGKDYITDYSFFLYPFQRDENRNIVKHSDYMSDELCHAILDHQQLLQEKEGEFYNFLEQLELKQIDKTTKENEKRNLENELKIILDEIAIKEEAGLDVTGLIVQRDNKKNEINNKQSEIDLINEQIKNIQNQIQNLKTQLSYEKNFTPEQLQELEKYKFEKPFEDSNITSDFDLLKEGRKYLEQINTPPIEAKVDIINVYKVKSYQKKWEKLRLGDFIIVQHERLGIDIKTRIVTIEEDFENNSISIEISNGKELMTPEKQFIKMAYEAFFKSKNMEQKSYNWDNIALNFNFRNDRIKEKPANPVIKDDGTAIDHTLNTDGTANISIEWEFNGAGDAYKIDGFILYMYPSISKNTYMFGSTISKEQLYQITPEKRSYIFTGVPADKYYTFGIQAYRRVDLDIAPKGILLSDLIQPTHPSENPYRPSENVEFKGDIKDSVVGGTPIDDYFSKTPVSGSYVGDGVGTVKTINLPWTPKQVIINGGYERDGVNYEATFTLFSSSGDIINTNNEFKKDSKIKCTTNGFQYGGDENIANVSGQLYDWVAYG